MHFLASGGFLQSLLGIPWLVGVLRYLSPSSHGLLPYLCVCPNFLLVRTAAVELGRAHSNLIAFAKTLFPNTVTFTRSVLT